MPCTSDWTIIREWKTANFRVELAWDYETDTDLSWADDEMKEELADGYVNCQYRVTVYWHGTEVGSDYLGDSWYRDPAEFAREHMGLAAKSRADGRNYGAYVSDMVREAIAEARRELRRVFTTMPRVRAV